MRVPVIAAAFALAAVPLAGASSQTAEQIANDPGAPDVNGAKAKLVDDAGVEGGKALRVTVPKKGANNWDSVVESSLKKPVKAGDRLVFYFDARLEKGPGDASSAAIPFTAIQMKAAPYSPVVSGNVTVTPKWEMHKIEGKADKDYPADALKATVQIGNARQTIDFGPLVVLNMGQ